MANRKLTYTVGIEADTTQFIRQLQEAERTLRNISTGRIELGKGIDQYTLNEAAEAAGRLANELRNATDVNTGKLDLSKFNTSLTNSGRKLEDYANTLRQLGPEGTKAFMDVAKAISQAELPAIRTNKVLEQLWVTMKNTVRWQITTSALNAFMGAIQHAYGYSQDLNESLNSIRIVTQKSTEDMKNFAEQANEAAKSLSTTTTSYTDASLIFYQQGKLFRGSKTEK